MSKCNCNCNCKSNNTQQSNLKLFLSQVTTGSHSTDQLSILKVAETKEDAESYVRDDCENEGLVVNDIHTQEVRIVDGYGVELRRLI